MDALLDTFHLAANDNDRVIALVRLYYATDAWLKKAKRGATDVNSRRTSGVYACFASVSYRLSELVQVPINLLPNWLTETFGKAMGDHGANLDVSEGLADYLSPEQVAKYRINLNGGMAYQQQWWLNSNKWVLANSSSIRDGTEEVRKKIGGAEGNVLTNEGYSGYVMSQGGDLYSGPHFATRGGKESARYHSSYFGGEPILCAGEILIEDGVIREINNSSGHYRPGGANISMMLELLMVQGVRLAQLNVYDIVTRVTTGATAWLQAHPTFQVAPAINAPGPGTPLERAHAAHRGDTPLARARMLQTQSNFAKQQKRKKAFEKFDMH
ncbi:MAG: hypothetical protein K2Q97_17390, partial [Burkholderiaceae bacterium]|nr:hypothetical protein [Burkholderiaceae bacterium]